MQTCVVTPDQGPLVNQGPQDGTVIRTPDLRGSLDKTRALLEEALDLSLAARSITFMTLCLAG